MRWNTFQFPTGWNSTDRSDNQHRRFQQFQFPTGWNSTITALKTELEARFQFPTGWNSTLIWSDYHHLDSCFNSQRDGILLYAPSHFTYRKLFQFPTGWNSTMKKPTDEQRLECFNSQRDGILPTLMPSIAASSRVSIPNGMEFYFSSPKEFTNL